MDSLQNGLEVFIERLPLGIIVLNADLRIEMRNELSFKLLDVGMENLFNTDLMDVVKDFTALKECVGLVHSGIAQQHFTMLSTGDKVLGCTALQAHDIIPNGLIVLIEDAANEKKIEQLKLEFIGTLLHKLRSPLATLKTSFSMLNHEIANPDPQKHQEVIEIVAMCSEEVNRLSSLVSDMRDLFLIETKLAEKDVELEDFPIDKAILAAIEALKKTLSPEIVDTRVIFTKNSDHHVLADFEKTKRIFFILIKNGLHYSPPESPVEVSLSNASDSINITIKDRGIGIQDSMTPLVFSKYFREDNDITRNRPGNGLGLFIAKSYIDLMKGSVYFETKQGEGTLFHVSLPLHGRK
jgi:two-component system, OmpR family, phosphate regulon sensor histidine kinase PhoR